VRERGKRGEGEKKKKKKKKEERERKECTGALCTGFTLIYIK